MAEDEDQDSRTEEPSEQKLRKARERGDVPHSKEMGTFTSVAALTILIAYLSPKMMPELAIALGNVIGGAAFAEVGEGLPGLAGLQSIGMEMTWRSALLLAPMVGVMLLAAAIGILFQGRTVVATERIRPKLSKISPMAGLKRMFSKDTLIEFTKSILKVGAVATIAYVISAEATVNIWRGEGMAPEAMMDYARTAASRILIWTTVLLCVIALGDGILKRLQWRAKQRMTLKELRDEHKDSDGDPHIKAKRAEIRRRRARQRIAAAVPTATVVITNPTHFAVALRYEQGRDMGPVCVAKGTDRVAAQIRELARKAEVPIIENRPLARALHAQVEVDDMVPVEHWQAVAEVIGYVMDLKRNLKRQPPAGSSLRED